ncbi:MAG: hypothetical protein K2X82_17055 [Gemmataceae bacterium]|nr:hypothetical protein [Gemmataceae bacterium]
MVRTTGIALAIAAGVAFSPARATAGCGDYVHIAGPPAGPTGVATAPPDGHALDDLPRPPCHGPGCSERPTPTAPPLTAPVNESAGAKELAARPGADDRADGSPRHRVPRSIGSPVHFPTAIFDPPRAA